MVLVVISVEEPETIQTLINSSQILLTCFISHMITTSVEVLCGARAGRHAVAVSNHWNEESQLSFLTSNLLF